MAFIASRDVQEAELLTSIFHGWPCFHDAEILRASFQREPREASLELTIHVFADGHRKRPPDQPPHIAHTLVTIRFNRIDLERFEHFNHQNVIDDLKIALGEAGDTRFVVDIPANNGCDATFKCESIEIISVEPYSAEQRLRDGSVYAES